MSERPKPAKSGAMQRWPASSSGAHHLAVEVRPGRLAVEEDDRRRRRPRRGGPFAGPPIRGTPAPRGSRAGPRSAPPASGMRPLTREDLGKRSSLRRPAAKLDSPGGERPGGVQFAGGHLDASRASSISIVTSGFGLVPGPAAVEPLLSVRCQGSASEKRQSIVNVCAVDGGRVGGPRDDVEEQLLDLRGRRRDCRWARR